MNITRRGFVAATAGSVAATAWGAPRAKSPATTLTFTFGESKFPVLLAGESAVASENITTLTSFKPVFGADRPDVNPAEPRLVGGAELVFDTPGEYYLRVNRHGALKAVVLPRDEAISRAVLRVFDFCVANMLYVGLEDQAWYRYHADFLTKFFCSTDPMMLSCGPTHVMFRLLMEDRFRVPTRIVTFPATFFRAGQVHYTSHNVPEVYLPDVGRFVLFDINNGFVAKWLDSFAITEAVRARWGDENLPGEHWTDLGLDMHAPIETRVASPRAYAEIGSQTSEKTIPFDRVLIGEGVTGVGRARALRALYGGPAYWGRYTTYVQPSGTEFLAGDYLFASYHTSDLLEKAAIHWVNSFDLEVTLVPPAQLKRQLEDGARDVIAQQAWRERYPSAVAG